MKQQQQETFYDPQTGEYYTYEQEPGTPAGANHQGKTAVYIVGYFALLAIIIVPAQHAHMGMQGVFFAMIGAALVLALVILVIKWARRKIEAMKLSRRGFFQVMVGYQSPQDDQDQAEAQEPATTAPGRGLVPATSTAIQPYDQGRADELADLPDTIIEDNPAHLSDTYQPNINTLLGATILLCGIRRSGKSNALAVLAEELARYYTPLLIGDTEDEYGPLVAPEYMPRGVMAGSIELYAEARRAGIRYIPIDRDGAYEFGQSIPRDVLQVVLNLQSFSEDEAAIIMSEIIDGMNDWEQSQPNARRVPCMFLLDEATKWLPQQIAESCIQDREALYLLQRAVFGTMVRRGGKRGLGLVLSAQRIAELDKRALQSIWKFFFKQTEEVDIARYHAHGLERDDVLGLRQGECFVFSPGVIGFRAMMRQRHSPHLAHTPGLPQLAAHLRRVIPLDLVTSRSYAGVSANQADEVDTEALAAQGQDGTEQRARAKTLEERAIDAWNEGYQSGRKLAAALNIGESAGNQLMNRLIAKGLIKKPARQEAPNE